jgi:hypothetical protein
MKTKNFEPIIQVLDFMNKLFSSKFPSTRPWRPGRESVGLSPNKL